MNCRACGAALDVDAFPGGSVTCPCGATTDIPGRRASQPSSAPNTPYRSAEAVVSEARMIQCPYCGGPCQPDVRACPHCDVELASVRCPHCFALHFAGSRFCARCGKELTLEPLLDATDAPCPRCGKALAAMTGQADLPMHECRGCGGLFVSQKMLDAILATKAPPPGSAPTGRSIHPQPVRREANAVAYLRCPLCHNVMNRVNFGRRSGVIVDVCKPHGVWFDKNELTQVIEFVEKGGLEEARRATDQEKHALQEEAAKLEVALLEDVRRDSSRLGFALGRADRYTTGTGESLLEILFDLFR